jgi:hypothetical protein
VVTSTQPNSIFHLFIKQERYRHTHQHPKKSAMQLFHKHKLSSSSSSELILPTMKDKEAFSNGMIMVVPGKFHAPPPAAQVDKKTALLLGQGGEGKGKHGFDCWHEKSYSRVMQKKNSFLGHLDDIATDGPHSTTRSNGCSSSTGGETHRSSTSTCTTRTTNSSSCHNDLHDHHGLRGVFRKVRSMVHRRPHHEDQDWK